MKCLFKTLAATCAIIPFAQCALLPGTGAARAAQPVAAEAAPAVDADPALWVVKDDDTTIYLFGTVHFLKPGLGWFDEAVKSAFDGSDELMLEMLMPEDPAAVKAVTDKMAIDHAGRTMASRMSKEAHAAYAASMVSVGLPPEAFEKYEPWFVAVNLSILPLLIKGYNPQLGPEMVLTGAAKASGKPIGAFETVEEQYGFFDNLSEASQLAYLDTVVRDMDKVVPTLDTLVAQWVKGDPAALAVTMNESMTETPEIAKILLYDRNARWADTLKTRMDKPGTVFVAVGAGHLAGDKSVQAYLTERGLTVQRVDY